jgi:hypothetical protein
VLTKEFVAFVSPEDPHHLQDRKWHAVPTGRIVYVEGGGSRKYGHLALHREIIGAGASDTDHKDHDGLNNRRENLRAATRSQNVRYQVGPSGFRGDRLQRRTGHWKAEISGGKLGTFRTPEKAARAYDKAAIKRFGEFAITNFGKENPALLASNAGPKRHDSTQPRIDQPIKIREVIHDDQ